MLLLLALICLTNIFSTAIVQTLIVALTVVVLSSLLTDSSFSPRRTPLDIPYLGFVLARVISLLFSQYPAQSLPALHIEFFYYVVFFLVTQSIPRNEPVVVSALVSLLLGAGLIAALIAVMKVALGMELRGSSTTAGTYTLGGYLCAVFPLALLYPRPREPRFYRDWIVPLGLCIGIVSTYDRLHWACMVLTIILAGFLTRKRALTIGLSAILALSLLSPSVRVRVGQVNDSGALLNGRDVLLRGAIMLIDDHPLVGFGPRTFPAIFPLFDEMPVRGVGSWHNDWLQIYMESGLLGLAAFGWLVFAVFTTRRRALRSPSILAEDRQKVLALTVSLGVLFLFGGVLDTLVGITFRTLLGIFAVLAGMQTQVSAPRPADVASNISIAPGQT